MEIGVLELAMWLFSLSLGFLLTYHVDLELNLPLLVLEVRDQGW